LNEVLTGLPLPALMIGADERISGCNAAALALLGAGLVGRHHAFVLRQPEVLAAISAAARGRQLAEARHVIPGPSHEVIHRVNGKEVLRYQKPQLDPACKIVPAEPLVKAGAPMMLSSGHLALQAEGQGVWFRNIELKSLEEE
jgi:hypothetical protein